MCCKLKEGGGWKILKVLEVDPKGLGVGSQKSWRKYDDCLIIFYYYLAKIKRINCRLNLQMHAPLQRKTFFFKSQKDVTIHYIKFDFSYPKK